MAIKDTLLGASPLSQLVQPENFVGWAYRVEYETLCFMTNDLWKGQVNGVPHNCFLVATSINPGAMSTTRELDREVILLRVTGSAPLPQDEDMVRTKVDHFQGQEGLFEAEQVLDELTMNQVQFGGLECRILGTFYMHENKLWLGSDIESFNSAGRLRVFRPTGDALQTIVNHVDPIREQAMKKSLEDMGIVTEISPISVGTVRYTSTDRMHRKLNPQLVPFEIHPSDFLARRTAVLGMTRTGKSNMVKTTVSMVKRVADEANTQIGQIIFDINGEYANANQQDKGAISEVYPEADVIRYRMIRAPGFRELLNNFYYQLVEGFHTIIRELNEAGRINSDYLRSFASMSLEEPSRDSFDSDQDFRSQHNRWEKVVAAYQAMLFHAGFEPPPNLRIKFSANAKVKERIDARAVEREMRDAAFPDPKIAGLSAAEAVQWFLCAQELNTSDAPLPGSSKGSRFVDEVLQNLLNMIAQKNGPDGNFISGFKVIDIARKYHSPGRRDDVSAEIYRELAAGKIVILDLSVGSPETRERTSKDIARRIFSSSMRTFVQGGTPPHVVIYIEEAHNLLGRKMDLTETWPRIAKEGAKYRIALVYATQEPSSVHPNILANTENWFVTHLNNEGELRELAKFYDFSDFKSSLLRAQDVGFARVKTLSGPFVVPVQINLFDAAAEKVRVGAMRSGQQPKGTSDLF